MAKRKHSRSLALARRSSVKPIVIRTTKVVKSKHHRRSGRGGLSRVGGVFSKHNITTVGAGFAVGMLEKMAFVQNLPSLPYIGKTGTIAIAAFLMSDNGRNRMAADVATSAAAICGYMLGSGGTIVGMGDPYGDGVDTSGYVAGW
jgi:hypothetical protein